MPRSFRPSRVSSRPTLEDFYAHFDIPECLRFVERSLCRAGQTEDDLPPFQRALLRDLAEPLDEEALAAMLAWWDYNLQALFDRGSGWNKNIPAKPRIDIMLEVTSKGNLRAEWFPRGVDHSSFAQPPECDFRYFDRRLNRHADITSRPSNELIFLHGVRDAIFDIEEGRFPLSHAFLFACKKAVDLLKSRLEPNFDVRMLDEIYIERGPAAFSSADEFFSSGDTVATWVLDDPAERLRLAEVKELDELEATHGFSEEALLRASDVITARTKGGPAAPHTYSDRIARELKKQGLAATPKRVERALTLIEKHRKPSNIIPLIRSQLGRPETDE